MILFFAAIAFITAMALFAWACAGGLPDEDPLPETRVDLPAIEPYPVPGPAETVWDLPALINRSGHYPVISVDTVPDLPPVRDTWPVRPVGRHVVR